MARLSVNLNKVALLRNSRRTGVPDVLRFGRIATVAVDAMTFHRPVMVGDLVSCYAEVIRVGRTSLTVRIDAWVERRFSGEAEQVTSATFTYVAIDEQRDGSRDQAAETAEKIIAATLPSDRCTESLLMPHSTSPILRCH